MQPTLTSAAVCVPHPWVGLRPPRWRGLRAFTVAGRRPTEPMPTTPVGWHGAPLGNGERRSVGRRPRSEGVPCAEPRHALHGRCRGGGRGRGDPQRAAAEGGRESAARRDELRFVYVPLRREVGARL